MPFKVNTAVKDVDGFFGYVAKVLYDMKDQGNSMVLFVDYNSDQVIAEHARNVEHCHGCECGNPFFMCHPEA